MDLYKIFLPLVVVIEDENLQDNARVMLNWVNEEINRILLKTDARERRMLYSILHRLNCVASGDWQAKLCNSKMHSDCNIEADSLWVTRRTLERFRNMTHEMFFIVKDGDVDA